MAQEGSERPTVGLVGNADAVADRAGEATDRIVACEAGSAPPADVDVLVAAGASTVAAVARRTPAQPILPVAAGGGLRSIPRSAVEVALERYGSDDWQTVTHSLLSVAVDGQTARSLFDACLVTAEPAQISAYAVASDGEQVATVRADGVVAATPAGTGGYARRVDAPVIPAGPSVLAVAPIAPFQTDPDTWVVPDDAVTVTVAREGTPVDVFADDRRVTSVGAAEPVTLAGGPSVRTVVVPESRSPFDREGAELEKH